MTRIAWFHPFSGIAGDMALAALLDAGAELAAVEAACRRLPLGPWELRARPVVRGGLDPIEPAAEPARPLRDR